eukprot:m.86825 g.86825  ORF g.86825 m.86825 type:complete len:527 (-) comp12816_c0_seq1:1824-3404(-)
MVRSTCKPQVILALLGAIAGLSTLLAAWLGAYEGLAKPPFAEPADVAHQVARSRLQSTLVGVHTDVMHLNVFSYDQFVGADVDGQDIGHIQQATPMLLQQVCNAMPSCAGFNTNGWLKRDVARHVASDADLWVKTRDPVTASLLQDQPKNAPFIQEFSRNQGVSIHQVKDHLALQEMLYSATAPFKVFMYDLPAKLQVPFLEGDYKYGAEVKFHRMLEASPTRTFSPELADAFYIPLPCTAMRFQALDRDEGQAIAEAHTAKVLGHIRDHYPFWDYSNGADHFYVCAHDMGASVAAKASALLHNAIAVVNTADTQDPFFCPHKDVSMPPHVGDTCPRCLQGGLEVPRVDVSLVQSERRYLFMFAGNLQRGRVRPTLKQLYSSAADALVIDGAMNPKEYMQALISTDFCLFLRGFRAWSPRLMDAVWAGCIPVILSDHYQLPLQQHVRWETFAIVLPEVQMGQLRQILLAHRDTVSQRRQRMAQVAAWLTWSDPATTTINAFHGILLEVYQRVKQVTVYRPLSHVAA